ncbi:hypothetical protein [Nocardia crassostreae]|uniref:hypothetical protein n=1 Tax=Nocardia crassostreae TaxID=53428 RepID=UPI00082F9CB1|nr:hypothetical protein [Nocardia crassostreae]
MDSDGLVAIELSNDEREVLRHGLGEWGGPAHCSDVLAVAMGFESVMDLHEQGRRLRSALIANEPLSARDWRRTLVATEFVFASDIFGADVDWSITTGYSDEQTITILRALQRKLGRALHQALYGHR